MSRTTSGIMRIKRLLNKVLTLDSFAADKIEELEEYVENMVQEILEQSQKEKNNDEEIEIFNGEEIEIFDDEEMEVLFVNAEDFSEVHVSPKNTFCVSLKNDNRAVFYIDSKYRIFSSCIDGIVYVEADNGLKVPFDNDRLKDFFYFC